MTLPTALVSSESNERYTPPHIIEAARRLMGEIDLDPASCAIANTIVGAKTYYTEADNGLVKPWYGRVWCNPPYGVVGGESMAGLFARRMFDLYHSGEFEQGLLLVNAAVSATWFQPLHHQAICFPRQRIAFLDEGLNVLDQPTKDNAIVYFGTDRIKFAEHFYAIGECHQLIQPRTFAVAKPMF